MAGNRSIITLECTDCKERNYTTTKNKKKTQDKLNALQVLPALPQAHSSTRRRSSPGGRTRLGQ